MATSVVSPSGNPPPSPSHAATPSSPTMPSRPVGFIDERGNARVRFEDAAASSEPVRPCTPVTPKDRIGHALATPMANRNVTVLTTILSFFAALNMFCFTVLCLRVLKQRAAT